MMEGHRWKRQGFFNTNLEKRAEKPKRKQGQNTRNKHNTDTGQVPGERTKTRRTRSALELMNACPVLGAAWVYDRCTTRQDWPQVCTGAHERPLVPWHLYPHGHSACAFMFLSLNFIITASYTVYHQNV